MGYRTIVISKASKISLKNNNFLYSPINDKSMSLPINDISVIILETHQVNITSALLSKLASKNVLVFSCDSSHIPNGIFLPFHQHSRFSLLVHSQVLWSEPFKKRIWQQIVSQKIQNQAKVLQSIKKQQEYKQLMSLSKNILSGDTDNKESYGARLYFSYLFSNFTRKNISDWRNMALNYGYSIIRAVIARDLSASGFVVALGVHHKNQLNAFNLADDIIEPFRAMIDKKVYEIIQKQKSKQNTLTIDDRMKLLSILQDTVSINKEKATLLNAVKISVQSLASCTKSQDYEKLLMPTL